MILDTMTYSVMMVVAVLSFIVILLEGAHRGRHSGSNR